MNLRRILAVAFEPLLYAPLVARAHHFLANVGRVADYCVKTGRHPQICVQVGERLKVEEISRRYVGSYAGSKTDSRC
jgi:hypothetical protein